jgi:hypothetical protein
MSRAATPLVRNQRAAMKPARPTNAAQTKTSPTVRNTARAIGAPPMTRTAMNVQYVPKPKLAQPYAKPMRNARQLGASFQR